VNFFTKGFLGEPKNVSQFDNPAADIVIHQVQNTKRDLVKQVEPSVPAGQTAG
jgi:hypothetical protein